MALKRIFNMSYAGGSKFTIYDVTETIRLEEGGSGLRLQQLTPVQNGLVPMKFL